MKPQTLLSAGILLLMLLFSCNRDEISFDAPGQELRFSKDTVFCDTVYHQVRSESYVVKVYNDEDKDISIPKISLYGGAESPYRINVDGKSGTDFSNVALRRKDSLYIFVEIAPTAMGPQAIAEDRIVFTTPVAEQHVTLFSVVQDAEFFVQTSATNSNTLSGTHTWNNNKAKIIYGNLTLAPGATLNINQGTKVYFFKNSGMKVSNGALLNVGGDLGNEVVFRGDRNDPAYDTIPKNWNSLKFEPGSTLFMNYAKVFGGIRGVDLHQATATLRNTIIHTFDEYGIYAVNSTVNAENLVMNHCLRADMAIFKGGNYSLMHATLHNYWLNGTSDVEALYASNEWINPAGQTEIAPLNLKIQNSILYTTNPNAVRFKPTSGQTFNYLIENSLLKYDTTAGFSLTGNPLIVNSYHNMEPQFMHQYVGAMNLRVTTASPARNKGNAAVAAAIPVDIVKVNRTANPTLGAYQ